MDWNARCLYLIFTPSLCHDDPWKVLGQAVDAGVHIVQWRAPDPDPEGLLRCLAICDRATVPVIVNDDVEAARRFGAAGVHIGQTDTPPPDARRRIRPGQVLGISTHDVEQAERAVDAGADYLGVGPCFPTATKGYDRGLDDSVLDTIFRATQAPAFAIGGITPRRVTRLRRLGCQRIAVGGAILSSTTPALRVAEFLAALAD